VAHSLVLAVTLGIAVTLGPPCAQDFESLRPQWMMDKDAYVFVFALDAKGSLAELDAFFQLYQEINEAQDVPIVLCGTKCDIVVCLRCARVSCAHDVGAP